MQILAFIALIASHGLASLNFFRTMRRGDMPKSIDFTAISVLLYFDLGLALEAAGLEYNNAFFPNIFKQPESLQIITLVIVALTPWLLRIGSWFVTALVPSPSGRPHATFKRKRLFYFVSVAICLGATIVAFRIAVSATVIWEARVLVGTALGPYIILLFTPLYLLAYYAVHDESQSRRGKMFAFFLAIASIAATLPVGERTFLLMPFMILALFYSRVSLERAMLAGVVAVICAGVILPLFKAEKSEEDSTILMLVRNVVDSDFYRIPVLADSIDRSRLVGTKILPYEGYGYVYSALFFVPRSLAPFKGYSTAQVFTSNKVGTSIEDTDWGFGIGAIDEIILNFGLLAVVPGLILYGVCFEALDTLSFWAPFLIVPTRLAAIWVFGYHFPALLQDFGAMVLLGILLQLAFSRVEKPKILEPA